MAFKRTGKETDVLPVRVRLVALADENVLLVDYRIVRQHLHRLDPSRVYRFVFRRGHGIEFGQFYPEGYRDIRILRYDDIVLNR